MQRDLSLVVDRDLPWSRLADVVTGAAGPSLESLNYLDTFAGGNLPEGKHSLHFDLTFRHAEQTLTGEEVERAMILVIQACADRLGATLRT